MLQSTACMQAGALLTAGMGLITYITFTHAGFSTRGHAAAMHGGKLPARSLMDNPTESLAQPHEQAADALPVAALAVPPTSAAEIASAYHMHVVTPPMQQQENQQQQRGPAGPAAVAESQLDSVAKVGMHRQCFSR